MCLNAPPQAGNSCSRKPHNHQEYEADSYSTCRDLSNGAPHFARDAREVDDPDFSGPPTTSRTNNHSPHPGCVGGGICRLSISRFCQVMIISPTGKSELVNRKEFTGDGERGVYWRWRLPKSSFHYLGIVRILLLITDR